MIAQNLILDSVPSLLKSEQGVKALSLMEVYKVSHLPVVNGTEYLGVISDREIFDVDRFEDPISSYGLRLTQPHVHKQTHLFEIVGIAKRFSVSVIPVLDDDHTYLGAITYEKVTSRVAELVSVDVPGAVIVLQMCDKDYTLNQISQIVESNNIKVLSLFVNQPSSSSTEVDITLKVNTTEISSLIRTFIRYDYKVKATYMDDSRINEHMDDRYDQFMRYLDT